MVFSGRGALRRGHERDDFSIVRASRSGAWGAPPRRPRPPSDLPHTHGALDEIAACLLGEGGRTLHGTLTQRYNDGERWVLHYVTAREMYNIAMAAMEGHAGSPGDYRNYVIAPPPIANQGRSLT